MRRTPALALAATTLLLTAACSSSEPPASADAPAAQTTSATPTSASEDAAPDLTTCLVGTWEQDMTDARAQMDALMGAGDEADVSFDGTGTMTFGADGSLSSTVDSTTTMAGAVDGVAVVLTAKVAGSTSGTWTVDGERMTIADLDMSGLTTDITTTADGVEVEIPGLDDSGDLSSVAAQAPPSETDVTCTDDELLLSTETGVDGMEPVTQRYTR